MNPLLAVERYHLIVTTAGAVYSWTNQGTTELFSSSSKGIVTSRNMHTDKDLLAVADSQIVILHDIEKGMQHTYRLKNADQGHIRKLFYHANRRRLFFTTTLQHAVQSFSLQESELLDVAPIHPSPPTVFAVSPACNLLVSASTNPPTVYLSRITCKQPPLLFIPNCSDTFVVSICFHPSRANVFSLGFQDGTIAAYNASVLPPSDLSGERFSYARIHGEISHLKNLHRPTHYVSPSEEFPGSEHSGLTVSTISGMQFIGSQMCSIISVGSDGNCFVVDYQSNGQRAAQVLQSWDLQTSATSLAVLNVHERLTQHDGANDDADSQDILLAIGKSDGTVNVHNRTGKLLATRDFSRDGRILDLEWTQLSENKAQSRQDRQASSPALQASGPLLVNTNEPEISIRLASKDSQYSIGSKTTAKLTANLFDADDYKDQAMKSRYTSDQISEQVDTALHGKAASMPEKQQISSSQQDSTTEAKQSTEPMVTAATVNNDGPFLKPRRSRDQGRELRRSSRTTVRSSGSSASSRKIRLPIIPPRPVPRPGGKLALRRGQSAKGRHNSIAPRPPVPNEAVHADFAEQIQPDIIYHKPQEQPKVDRPHDTIVSPSKKAPELYPHTSTPTSSLPLAAAPLTSKSPTAPLQYNRLARSISDIGSNSSASWVSFHRDSHREYSPKLLARTHVKDIPVTKHSTSKRNVLSKVISDSGASAVSILDWTPSQGKTVNAPSSDIIGPSLRPEPSKTMSRNDQADLKKDLNSDSNVSIVSHLDWHDGTLAKEMKGFDMIDTSQSINISSKADEAGRPSKANPTIPVLTPAPLNITKSRKQPSATGPTSGTREPALTRLENAASINNKPAVDTSAQKPKLSGAESSALRLPNTDTARKTVMEENPLPPRTAPLVPGSSNATTTRGSSLLRGILNLPQMRPGSTDSLQSKYTIEDIVRQECTAICRHIDNGFQEQKAWLQGFLKEQDWYVHRLEDENRQFREELARLRKA